MGGEGGEWSRIIRPQESLALYKSFILFGEVETKNGQKKGGKERKSRQKTGLQKESSTLFHILAFKSLGTLSELRSQKVSVYIF
jgi:hypothetical protein